MDRPEHSTGSSKTREVDGFVVTDDLAGLPVTDAELDVKAAACWLNERGYRTRRGARWGIGPLHKLVTNVVYKGEAVFNRMDSKTRESKPASERITVEVEPIIAPAVFDAVQAQLKQRNPRVMPPRVVTGPTLLTGLATCASCGGGMTLRTGKSGRYRYYVCAAAAQKGKTACEGRSLPMERLDRIVTDRLGDQLLTVERVRDLLSGLMERQSRREADHAGRLTALRGKLSEAEGRLGRLYQAIENGIADPNDPTLKDRLAAVKTERDIAQAAFDRVVGEMSPEARITEEKVAAFVELMRKNALSGETAFRRAWLRAVIDRVEVGDTEIRIHGRKTVLERLVMAGNAVPAGVPSFVRKWRARRECIRTSCSVFSKSGVHI